MPLPRPSSPASRGGGRVPRRGPRPAPPPPVTCARVLWGCGAPPPCGPDTVHLAGRVAERRPAAHPASCPPPPPPVRGAAQLSVLFSKRSGVTRRADDSTRCTPFCPATRPSSIVLAIACPALLPHPSPPRPRRRCPLLPVFFSRQRNDCRHGTTPPTPPQGPPPCSRRGSLCCRRHGSPPCSRHVPRRCSCQAPPGSHRRGSLCCTLCLCCPRNGSPRSSCRSPSRDLPLLKLQRPRPLRVPPSVHPPPPLPVPLLLPPLLSPPPPCLPPLPLWTH